MLTPNLAKIPQELKDRRQWVVWKMGKDDKGRPTKHPYTPHNPKWKAKSNDPKTWNTFEKAAEVAGTDGFNGVGYVFSENCPHTGIDLDKCRDPETGELKYCARILINSFNSYSEVSPRKRGIHTISEGKWLQDAGNKRVMPCRMEVEVYDQGRYFTMTGAHLEDTPTTIEKRQEMLTALARAIFTRAENTTKTPGPSPTLELSDQELIDKAHQAANGEKFGKLMKGSWQGDYPSESEATAALLNHLAFWFNRDPGRMDRVFRGSGLMRGKWDRKQSGSTWGAIEIQKAIDRTPEGYNPQAAGTGKAKEAPRESQDTGKGQEQKKKPTIVEITGAELSTKEFPEPRWAVSKLIPEGYGVLGGRPKIGKSWFALETALAVAKGGFVLGSDQYPANEGSVRYLALEDNERRLKDRQHTLLCGEPDPPNLFIVTKHPRLDQGGIEALDTWLTAHPDCRLVIIDTLAKVKPKLKRGGDAYEHVMDYGGQLQDLAHKHRACLLAIHHTRKSKSETDDFIDELAGSTGITGAPDFIMLLERRRSEETGYLHTTGRDLEDLEIAVKFSPGEGTWTLLGPAEEYRMSEQKLKIVNALKDANAPLTPKDISEITLIPHGSVKHLLAPLCNDGPVRKVSYGKYEYKK